MPYTGVGGGAQAGDALADNDRRTTGNTSSGLSGNTASGHEEFWLGLQDTPFVDAKAIPITSESQNIGLDQLLVWLSQSIGGFDPGIGFAGSQLPGMTDLQNASLSGLEAIAGGDTTAFQDPTTLLGLQTIQEMLRGGPEDFTDYFETGVADPAERDLERALNQISAQSVGSSNLFGSDRSKAQRSTTEDFFRNLSEERSRFGLQSMGLSDQNKLAALGQIPGLANMGLERGARLFELGEQERNVGVQQHEAEFAEMQRQEQVRQFILELMLRAGTAPTFGIAGGFGLEQPPPSSGGFVGGLLGGLSPPSS